MNAFAMLDTSDNEEEVTLPKGKQPTVVKAKNEGKAALLKDGKTSDKPKENEKKVTAPPKSISTATSAQDEEGVKENNRGGRARGKEGSRRGEKKYENGGKKEEAGDGRKEKREFERRSGTGRGREVSRGGRGPYNSGNVNQEAQDAEKNPTEDLLDATPAVDDDVVSDTGNALESKEEKVITVSIEDYLRQKEEARACSKILGAQQSVRTVSLQEGLERMSLKARNEVSTNGRTVDRKALNDHVKNTVFELGFKFNSPSAAPFRPPRAQDGDRERYEGNRPTRVTGRSDGRRPGGRGEKRPSSVTSINHEEFPELK